MYILSRICIPNGNIAFCKCNPSDIVEKKVNNHHYIWMKHLYNDRFFADPFILKVTENEIEVLVEELNYVTNKGIIVKLIINTNTYCLIERKTVLELGCHLSYPAIYRLDNEIFIVPEKNQSGCLNLYKYDVQQAKAELWKPITNLPLNDSTILFYNNKYWLFATITGKEHNKNLYIMYSDSPFDNYSSSPILVKSNLCGSRPAGHFFEIAGHVYRPAQDCSKVYGGRLIINKLIELDEKGYKEEFVLSLSPMKKIYNVGIHHIDFYNGWSVVDGYGYKFSLLIFILRIKRKIKSLFL